MMAIPGPTSILRLLVLAALPALLAGCMRYNEVELLAVHDAQITWMDAQGLSAVVTVEIINPNNYAIQVMDPDVDLFVNGSRLGKATMDEVLVLEARSTRTYDVPLRATFSGGGMLPILMGSALSGTMMLKAQGTVVGKARSLRKRFPFELEHELDLR